MLAARAFDRVVALANISILARLLLPSDFGLLAIASTVVAAVGVFNQFGFDWALVRHPDPTARELNTAWTLRALVGLAVFVAITLISPLAARFYREAPLEPVLVVLGLSTFAVSLENIGTVYFRREFAFDREFLIRAITKLVTFVTTVLVAVLDRSYWALVSGILAGSLTGPVLSYMLHPYRPRPSLSGAKSLFGFSSWVLIGEIADFFRQQFGNLYLGRVFGAEVTGIFSVGGQVAFIPLEIAGPINRVAYSKYSQDIHQGRDLKASYTVVASFIWLFALPMSLGTVVVAPQLVALLLGPNWTGSVPVLRWMAIGTAFSVMVANTHYIYWALGHPRVTALFSIISAVVLVPMCFIGAHMDGYVGVSWAFALESAIIAPINFFCLWRIAGVSFLSLWEKVWRISLGTCVMLALLQFVVSPLVAHMNPFPIAQLALEVVTGGVIYAAVTLGLWLVSGMPSGPESLFVDILRSRVAKLGWCVG